MEIKKEELTTNNNKLKALGDKIVTCDIYQLGVSDAHRYDLTRALKIKSNVKVSAAHAKAISEQYLTSSKVYIINEVAMKEEKDVAEKKIATEKAASQEHLTGKKRQAELDGYSEELKVRECKIVAKEKELAAIAETYDEIHEAIESRESAIEKKEAELKAKEESLDTLIKEGVEKELAAKTGT